MEKTTLAWLVLALSLCLAAFTPQARGQCPVGENRQLIIYSCDPVNYDLRNALTAGNAETFEWQLKAPVNGINGASTTLRTGLRITDALTNTTNSLQTLIYTVVPIGPENCRGNAFEVRVEVRSKSEVTGCIACNSLINQTLGSDCRSVLTLEKAAEGEESSNCANSARLLEALYVVVFDGVYPNNDPQQADNVIEKAGTFNYEIRLRPEYADCFAWTPCWGQVKVEDKTPPTVSCPPDVIGLVKTTVAPHKAEAVVDGVGYVYRPGLAADAGCSPEALCDDLCPAPANGFLYLVCTDVDSILRVERSWKDETYPYYTGFPTVKDCGSTTLVSVEDQLTELECGTEFRFGRQVQARIARTFTYRDDEGNIGSCVQTIYFFRPEIILPACKASLDLCKYPGINTENASSRLDPLATGTAPYYVNASCRRMPLLQHVCGFTAEYADQVLPGPTGCGVKVIRKWTFLDWCWDPKRACESFVWPLGCETSLSAWENKKRVYEQHLIVADENKPKVACPANLPVFSTGPFDCLAVIQPPAPVVSDECSAWTWEFELFGELLDPKTGIVRPNQRIATSTNQIATGIAPGQYDLHYIVRDACGNTTRHICVIRVVDAINPVAVCDDNLRIAIGGSGTLANGIARVAAADIDEGSNDNCGIARLQARREIKAGCLENYSQLVLNVAFPNGFTRRPDASRPGVTYYLAGKDTLLVDERGTFYSWWRDAVFFTCCDISVHSADKVRIELRATDYSGNTNICWLSVLIEDKLPPSCEVHNASIRCTDIDFNPLDPVQVAARFGSPESVVKINDNCGATIAEELRWTPGNCGTGLLERIFTVTDISGFSTRCTQRITVEEVNVYTARFPRDLENAACGVAPSDSLIQATQGCDIIAINRDTARFDATDNECFKFFVTYTIINWCEYDGESPNPTLITRDLDADNLLSEYTYLEAGYERVGQLNSRFPLCSGNWGGIADGDGFPDSVFVVKLFAETNGRQNALPEIIYVRGTCADRNTHVGLLTLKRRNTGDAKNPVCYEPLCPSKNVGQLCASQTYANQCWTPGYYQYTQILKVYDNVPPTVKVVSNDFDFCIYGDPSISCEGQVDIAVELSDNCSALESKISRVRLLLHQDPNQAFELGSSRFQLMVMGNTYLVRARLPVGKHSYLIQAVDGCGNQTGQRVDFTVRDCKAPTPICINGVTLELMPVDTNGDGVIDGGMNSIEATRLIASPVVDCAGPVVYSINRVGEKPDRSKVRLTFTCSDPIFETIPIEVHAWDPDGNRGSCETFIIVQDNRNLCRPPAGRGTIAGLVLTEEDEPVDQVEVKLSGQKSETGTTADDGAYSFQRLQEGYDYSVTPARDGDYLNGVSTFDLVLMSKHILGVKAINSPYKLIAADVNRSGSVTTLDIIALRKVILNVDLAFKNNSSWRFIPKSFRFPNPNNPFGSAFPEVLNLNNLSGRISNADFVAVKVGDVNASVQANSLLLPQTRGSGEALSLSAADQQLQAGEEWLLPVVLPVGQTAVEGLQLSLQASNETLELLGVEEGLVKSGDFGFFPEEGRITLSWLALSRYADGSDNRLFSLRLRARKAVRLSEAILLSGTPTPVEAYTTQGEQLDVMLVFHSENAAPSAGFELRQNVPNPFRESTTIGFVLPQEGQASLDIRDESGRQVYFLSGNYAKGYHEIRVERRNWPASGVLFYTLHTDRFRATRAMVLTP